jgi:hypothetical protein
MRPTEQEGRRKEGRRRGERAQNIGGVGHERGWQISSL